MPKHVTISVAYVFCHRHACPGHDVCSMFVFVVRSRDSLGQNSLILALPKVLIVLVSKPPCFRSLRLSVSYVETSLGPKGPKHRPSSPNQVSAVRKFICTHHSLLSFVLYHSLLSFALIALICTHHSLLSFALIANCSHLYSSLIALIVTVDKQHSQTFTETQVSHDCICRPFRTLPRFYLQAIP